MTFKQRILPVFIVILVSIAPSAWTQSAPVEGEAGVIKQVVEVTQDKGPDDALGRGTPRGSIVGYMKACSEFDFEKAAEYLDLRNLPRDVQEVGGPELARQLNHVLSRSVWLDDYSVSDHPEGVKGDGLPDYRDELVTITTEEGDRKILMQRVPRGDGEMIWKLSNRSVALIPEMYQEFSYPPRVETVRGWFSTDGSFLGFEYFKWFILIGVVLAVWPLFYLLGRLLTRIFTSINSENYWVVRKVFTGPFVATGILIVTGLVIDELGAGVFAQQILEAKTVVILVFIWAAWNVLNLYREHHKRKMERAGRPGAAKLMRPITTFLKILVLLVGSLFWLSNIGVNVSTVLAGLGVGGLALALALQKPIEDMMGALTIFSQATIKAGDFCKYGEITGTVEDIGLRTTRVRTLSDTLVSIPNARIAHVEVENISARSKIRYWPTLRLRYDTTAEQLKNILSGIEHMLRIHDSVHDDPVRVRFTEFEEDAVLVKLHSFLKTTDYAQSLEIGEELNMRILEIVESAGARFALPGRSIVMEGQP